MSFLSATPGDPTESPTLFFVKERLSFAVTEGLDPLDKKRIEEMANYFGGRIWSLEVGHVGHVVYDSVS